jgi:hypothetical protein
MRYIHRWKKWTLWAYHLQGYSACSTKKVHWSCPIYQMWLKPRLAFFFIPLAKAKGNHSFFLLQGSCNISKKHQRCDFNKRWSKANV